MPWKHLRGQAPRYQQHFLSGKEFNRTFVYVLPRFNPKSEATKG